MSNVFNLLSVLAGSGNGAVTAAGVNSQANATLLTSQISYVTAGSQSDPAGVRLPPGRPAGEVWIVMNNVGSPASVVQGIGVWPSTGETILPMAANARDLLQSAMMSFYISLGGGLWRGINLPTKSDSVSVTASSTWYFYQILNAMAGLTIASGLTVSSGLSTLAAGLSLTGGQEYKTIPTTLTTGAAAIALDWNTGNQQIIDLQGANGTVTVTMSNPQTTRYTIKVIQGSVARNITWSPTIKWPAGVAPTISVTNDAVDKIELFWDGTIYIGTFTQAHA